MTLLVGENPVAMTVIVVQGSSADLVVPADIGVLSAPRLEFAVDQKSAAAAVSHQLALESGEWVVHLSPSQVASLLSYRRARVVDGSRTVAAGVVHHNPGWDGYAVESRIDTRIIWGGGSGGSGGSSAVVLTQSAPAASWTFQHSLGRVPAVTVYVGGEVVDADVTATATQVSVSFPAPVTGQVVIA